MPAPIRKPKTTWFTLLILVAALALWAYDQKNQPHLPSATPATPAATVAKAGRYEVFQNCTLMEARHNDGDSFMIRLPNAKTAEFRLYFVDAPESAFKSYGGGATNHARISQQAADLGGITPEQAVAIGKKGKAFTLGLLASQPFILYSEWDSPYNDGRYHAHIQVFHEGKTRWLHQILIERGLARIRTKPADLPDGTTAARELENLRNFQSQARRKSVGAWGN